MTKNILKKFIDHLDLVGQQRQLMYKLLTDLIEDTSDLATDRLSDSYLAEMLKEVQSMRSLLYESYKVMDSALCIIKSEASRKRRELPILKEKGITSGSGKIKRKHRTAREMAESLKKLVSSSSRRVNFES